MLAAVLWVASPLDVSGQTVVPTSGRIVDQHGAPIVGARIIAAGPAVTEVTSSRDGQFEVLLAPGVWNLSARKLGYLPAERKIVVGNTTPISLAPIILTLRPVHLRALTVTATGNSAAAYTVTRATASNAPAVSEPDVFRAIALLPGVGMPNDWTGRLHIAGGASDETGVTIDGHPMQNITHLYGVLSGLPAAMIERADVFMADFPSQSYDRLSGIIDVQLREPPRDKHSGSSTTSLLSSGAVLTWPIDSVSGLLVSGRVTYIDKLPRAIYRRIGSGEDAIVIPSYSDAAVKASRRLGRGLNLDVLGLVTRDALRSIPLQGSESSEIVKWGETLLGTRLGAADGKPGLTARLSLSSSSVTKTPASDRDSDRISIDKRWLSAAAEWNPGRLRRQVSIGVSLDVRAHQQSWLLNRSRSFLSDRVPRRFAQRDEETIWGGFVSGSRSVGPWSLTAGGKLASNGRWVGVGPRAIARYTNPNGRTAEITYNRRYQFDVLSEEPMEGSITPPVFLLEKPAAADVVGFAWRQPIGGREDEHLRVYGFAKSYGDRPVERRLLSAAAVTDTAPFPDFLRVAGYGGGIGLLVSRRVGPAMLQAGYAFQRIFERIDGQTAPSSWDAPHSLTTLLNLPLGDKWSVHGVLHARSGTAVTPVAARIFVPSPPSFFSGDPRYLPGARNSARLPPYKRFDVSVRREWKRGSRLNGSVFLQAMNLSNAANSLEYDWQRYFCERSGRCEGSEPSRRGMPFLPSIGLDIRW
ncbi:MAG: Plug and carboxypeptidase regulatory-like domain-containing protein [Gemmatimonadaceae bacterium]|nr:Plug and carboxypeptidase regulatory-like domain-containing protein [Gemmatimonadaceae bacterium]